MDREFEISGTAQNGTILAWNVKLLTAVSRNKMADGSLYQRVEVSFQVFTHPDVSSSKTPYAQTESSANLGDVEAAF